MEYQVLARKWRPQQFDEVVGQEHVTTTLKNAIVRDRVAHAYLFTGPRGIGKTSMARILAKALNCEKGSAAAPCDRCPSCKGIIAGNSMDVLEIDGASNRGIDQIRELRENVKFAPSSSRYKIYIIDEVHQITPDAFNALLKTLEEPPPHVKFFFATTEPHKVPATILSRCQRFDLRSISPKEIVDRLTRIAKSEKIAIDEEACFAIARYAQGSMRDAESILDQLVSFSEGRIGEEDVISMLGLVKESVLREMTDALINGDFRKGLELIGAIAGEGKELPLFLADWITYLRSIMLVLVHGAGEGEAGVSPEAWKAISSQSKKITLEGILYVLEVLTRADQQMKWALSPRILLELAFMKAAKVKEVASLPEILNKIRSLERRLTGSAEDSNPPGDTDGAAGDLFRPSASSAGRDRAEAKKATSGRGAAAEVKNDTSPDALAAAAPVKPQVPQAAGDTEGPRRSPPADGEVLARVHAVWSEVLERVATVRPLLKSYLIEGKPAGFAEGVLCVEFAEDRAYHRDSLDHPQHKKLLKNILCERLGADVGIRFDIKKKIEKKETVERGSAPRKEIQNLKKNPLIQSALEMFQAQVIDIKK
jgi:DNA polymerase III subunit gamma/tau